MSLSRASRTLALLLIALPLALSAVFTLGVNASPRGAFQVGLSAPFIGPIAPAHALGPVSGREILPPKSHPRSAAGATTSSPAVHVHPHVLSAAVVVAEAPVSATFATRGAFALARLGLTPAAHGFQIVFNPGRSGFLGLANLTSGVLNVYIRPGEDESLLEHVIAHEYGHLLDGALNSPARRQAYLRARGLSQDTAWFPTCTCTDFAFGAGDWAETYATWLTGPSQWHGRLSAPPQGADLERVAAFFER